jgi:glycosyltransferase involved in cell wall biosynthesis
MTTLQDLRKEPVQPKTSERGKRRSKVFFLAPGDVGKGRVEPISWVQTCHAYAERGFDVTLVALRVRRPDSVPPARMWEHYGLEPSFRIARVPTLLGRDAPVWWFRSWAGLAALGFAIPTLIRQATRPDSVIVHARAPILAVPFVILRVLLPSSRRPHIVFEAHSMPRRSHGWIVRRVDLCVTNSAKLARDIAAIFGVPPLQIVHAPLGPYNRVRARDKTHSRGVLGLPQEAAIAAYVGKMTREICEFLLQTAMVVRPRTDRFRLLLVGGNPTILDWTRRRVDALGLDDTIISAGFVEPASVELYQAAADVLLLYVPESIGTFPYCTPSKGYEYQAASRTIVAADIPLFEEVFGSDGERAIRVRDHSPHAMADGVIRALTLEDGGRAMSERAAEWVKERTWERRAQAILEALGL